MHNQSPKQLLNVQISHRSWLPRTQVGNLHNQQQKFLTDVKTIHMS